MKKRRELGSLRRMLFALLMALTLTTGAWASPKGYVALTFDDGPSGSNTEALLEMLERQEVKATFFLCGYRMDSYPDFVKALSQAGHELGVHGDSHACFDSMNQETLKKEVEKTAKQIEALSGAAPKLQRPPCGSWNEAVRSQAREAGETIILWSVDSLDWQGGSPEKMAQRVCKGAENGSIILMHDMYRGSIQAAEEIIVRLRDRGYAFVTVSELAALAGCEMQPGEVFSQFPGAQAPEEE